MLVLNKERETDGKVLIINRPFYPLSRVENREELEGKPENVYTNKRSLTVVVVIVATAEEEQVTFRAKDKLVVLAAKKEDARQDISIIR